VPESETGSGVVATPWRRTLARPTSQRRPRIATACRAARKRAASANSFLGARLAVNFTDNRGAAGDPGVMSISGGIVGVSQFIWLP
jgi:hypothetical protein